jgi:iron transport multicopper oxidase
MSTRALLLAALAVSRSWGYTIDIVNQQVAPDGVTRQAIAAIKAGEERGPIGPLLTFNKGDNFEVLVNNKLADPTMRRSTSIVRLV